MAKKSNAQRKEKMIAQELEQMADAIAEMVAEDAVSDGKKDKVAAVKVELTDEQLVEYGTFKTKSAQIRYLASLSYGRSSIAAHLGIRYQHVRNVLETPLKRTV